MTSTPRSFARSQRLEAGRAAIDADDQRRAAIDQLVDRLGIRPVALEDAVGNIDARRSAERGEHAVQERRRGRAVDVVVAEDRDAARAASTASASRDAAASMSASEDGSGRSCLSDGDKIGGRAVRGRRRARRARARASPTRCRAAPWPSRPPRRAHRAARARRGRSPIAQRPGNSDRASGLQRIPT